MIARDEVMPLLVAACPSFAKPWDEYRSGPLYEAEQLYLHLGEFAVHLVGLLARGETGELPSVFAAIERVHVEGDPEAREAATIGLLEGIQNVAGDAARGFEQYLGPESARWWSELNRFWKAEVPYVGAGLKDGDVRAATLVVFARAPELGRVKTRLAEKIGAEAALALYRAFLDDTCALARRAERRVLQVAGDPQALAQLAAKHGMQLEPQEGGDLGARMANAIAKHAPCCIIGSDSPSLPPEQLQLALRGIAEHEFVVGPSTDGGYWLIGARAACPWLFEGIAWSGPKVFFDTLAKLKGRDHVLLPFHFDVDEAPDLATLRAHLKELPATVAPATRAALAGLAGLALF
jgi:rSAM/selenodomain-associated transferase 1